MKETTGIQDNEQLRILLKKIEKLNQFSETMMSSLLKLGKIREYEPREDIIKEGQFDCWIYFLLHGLLEVNKNGKKIRTLGKPGDLIGEMAVIDGSARSASVIAEKHSILLGIDASVLERLEKNNDVLCGYTLYKIFADILSKRVRDLSEENINLRAKLEVFKSAKVI